MRYSSYLLPVALVVVILLVTYSVMTGRALESSQPRSPTPAAVPVQDVPVPAMGQDTGWRPVIVTVPGADVAAVPPACLMMPGSEGSSDERPIHPACFDRPIWINRYAGPTEPFGEFDGLPGRGTERADVDRFHDEPNFDFGGFDFRRAAAYE
jgi:hypothetical protein